MNSKNTVMGILFIVVGLTFAGLGIWVQFIRISDYVPVEAEIIKIEKRKPFQILITNDFV